jgi:sugar-specific transcriptional regulator TrmB
MENTTDLRLTAMEQSVLNSLIENLYAEPGFSDVSPQDLSRYTKIPMRSLRGVLSSLSKKGIIWLTDDYSSDREFVIVYLCESHYNLHPEWKNEQ